MSHTPGPWKRIAIGKRQVISSEHGWLVELPERGEPETDLQAKRLEADYTLIAAAPDLLKALKDLLEEAAPPLDFCENCGCHAPDVLCSYHVAEKEARAAIAKAESPISEFTRTEDK